MYHCPKEGGVALQPQTLPPGLNAHHCPSCGGNWIPPEHYADWQQTQAAPPEPGTVAVLPLTVAAPTPPSSLDNRAALCPDCRSYLVRGRLNLQNCSFFVERCPSCGGIWCDGGEWEILQALQLHTCIPAIFSSDWQARVRQLEHGERERQATIDKLGPDLAERLFALANELEDHPNGDFGVAFLMRRFDQS